jgi:SM-20-related protein
MVTPPRFLEGVRRWSALGRNRGAADVVPYLRVTDFLPRDVADEMLAGLLERRDQFRIRGSSGPGGGKFYRMTSPSVPSPTFLRQLSATLAEVENVFALDLREPQLELLAQAYNDGSAFGLHSDAAAGGPNWKRRVSGVFYLHGQPRRFSGGELAIHDERGRRHLVPADHNSIVMFRREALHEVLPVTCPLRLFEDSRFSINVWVS